LLEEFGPGVRAVYEAGPTGFGLARPCVEHGLDLRVCAPGLIPRKPADRVKTDARDAERLARLLAAGELSFVRVPTVEEEHVRDLYEFGVAALHWKAWLGALGRSILLSEAEVGEGAVAVEIEDELGDLAVQNVKQVRALRAADLRHIKPACSIASGEIHKRQHSF
jgi:hypothetical protein